jgi:hypothetical protein
MVEYSARKPTMGMSVPVCTATACVLVRGMSSFTEGDESDGRSSCSSLALREVCVEG